MALGGEAGDRPSSLEGVVFGHDWEEAEATVIAVKDLKSWTGDPSSQITQSPPHEYVVDVRPGGGAPFRATFRDPYVRGTMADHPREGQTIKVLCQPKAQKAKLIESEWKHSADADKEAKRAEDDRFEAAKKDAPGSPGGSGGSGSDQLEALGERLERGEITEAEFDAEVQRVMAPR
jgi:hypothetical protein